MIYETEDVFPKNEDSLSLFTTITTIYPGDINGEYFMTKGHCHNNETDEIYYGIEGTGKIIEEALDGLNRLISPIGPGVLIKCDGKKAHRVVNDGEKILKFVCVGRADTYNNYNYDFETKLKKE